jgi:hypothetical protein
MAKWRAKYARHMISLCDKQAYSFVKVINKLLSFFKEHHQRFVIYDQFTIFVSLM